MASMEPPAARKAGGSTRRWVAGRAAARRSLAFRAQFVPGAQVFRRFAALAAVAAAVADEVAAAGATTGAEDRGVEFLGAQLVP